MNTTRRSLPVLGVLLVACAFAAGFTPSPARAAGPCLVDGLFGEDRDSRDDITVVGFDFPDGEVALTVSTPVTRFETGEVGTVFRTMSRDGYWKEMLTVHDAGIGEVTIEAEGTDGCSASVTVSRGPAPAPGCFLGVSRPDRNHPEDLEIAGFDWPPDTDIGPSISPQGGDRQAKVVQTNGVGDFATINWLTVKGPTILRVTADTSGACQASVTSIAVQSGGLLFLGDDGLFNEPTNEGCGPAGRWERRQIDLDLARRVVTYQLSFDLAPPGLECESAAEGLEPGPLVLFWQWAISRPVAPENDIETRLIGEPEHRVLVPECGATGRCTARVSLDGPLEEGLAAASSGIERSPSLELEFTLVRTWEHGAVIQVLPGFEREPVIDGRRVQDSFFPYAAFPAALATTSSGLLDGFDYAVALRRALEEPLPPTDLGGSAYSRSDPPLAHRGQAWLVVLIAAAGMAGLIWSRANRQALEEEGERPAVVLGPASLRSTGDIGEPGRAST